MPTISNRIVLVRGVIAQQHILTLTDSEAPKLLLDESELENLSQAIVTYLELNLKYVTVDILQKELCS